MIIDKVSIFLFYLDHALKQRRRKMFSNYTEKKRFNSSRRPLLKTPTTKNAPIIRKIAITNRMKKLQPHGVFFVTGLRKTK